MPKQLVVQLARFGDILQTKRLILSLQKRGETHCCVDSSLAELARLVYPGVIIHAMPLSQGGEAVVWAGGLDVLQHLRSENFDAVYTLNHAGISRALARLFPPEIVLGYPVAAGQEMRSNWVRLAFRWMEQRANAPINLVDFWAALAPSMIEPADVNPEAVPGGRGLGVVMAGQHARRSLPPDVLAPVLRAAFERLGGPPVYLFGSKHERSAAQHLTSLLPASVAQKVNNLAGKTDWLALGDALRGLDLLLSPDTGTAHYAAALGVPVEGLFLSSAWAFETGPYGKGHRIWQAMLDCSPCVESTLCPRHTDCLAPFRSPPFLARMQGRSGGAATRPLDNMRVLESGFDELGLIWMPAENQQSMPMPAGRDAMRHLLMEYLRLPQSTACIDGRGGGATQPNGVLLRNYAEFLYQEADWVLPQSLP